MHIVIATSKTKTNVKWTHQTLLTAKCTSRLPVCYTRALNEHMRNT